MSVDPVWSAIAVRTFFKTPAFLLTFTTTHLSVDGGEPIARPWGETFIPVEPGRHSIRCWFRWLHFSTAGDSTLTVDVAPGQVIQAAYKPPHFMFRPGKWQVSSSPSASWFPDPSGRHQLRYWNGSEWTPHVADSGTVSSESD
jgi:hypothetical protein